MEYRPQETAYLESTIGVPDQQQSRSLVPDTRFAALSLSKMSPFHPQRSHVRPEPKPSACPAPRTKVFGKQDTKVGGRDLLPFPPIKVANKHFMVSLNVLSF